MLAGEVVEAEQDVTILDQLGDRLVVFDVVSFREELEGRLCLSFGFRLPDVVQMTLGFSLQGFWHCIEHIPALAGSHELSAISLSGDITPR